MDRTMIAPYKAEEKDLSEKLYKKLEGLMLIYPPNEELKKHFTKDMFIKPNQVAFFQVFHYLMRIHDAAEFKRRFYWPITDKRSESSFRCSTVEYLKFLSEKHNLNWNVKSYLVQMPGGMKFITFVLDFIGFVIGEQIRLREKQLGIEIPLEGFSESNLVSLQKKHKFLKEYTADYLTEVEQQTLYLRRTTQLIKDELNKIENGVQVDIDRKFIKGFEVTNELLFETKFIKHGESIIEIEKSIVDLKRNIDTYQQKALESRKNKSTLRQALQKISDPQVEVLPTLENSIVAFLQIQPIMEKSLGNINDRNSAISSDMTSELVRLQTELEQMEEQLTVHHQKFKTTCHLKVKEENGQKLVINQTLISKYISTPPIKVNPTENLTSRLPLLGEINLTNNLDITRSASKATIANTSFDLSTTLNRSLKIDPMQMLRTIYKDSTKRMLNGPNQSNGNLSSLGLKWKERQQLMFGADASENITPIKVVISTNTENLDAAKRLPFDIKISSPMTPFNAHSDDITRIAFTQSPSVKKVDVLKEDAFNIRNLSTSPTGRLEPLCFADEFSSIQNGRIDSISKATLEDTENNQNSVNIPKKLSFDFNSIATDDSIFNTSDTVLKDVL